MSTHKRKGSDFRAVSTVASIVPASRTTQAVVHTSGSTSGSTSGNTPFPMYGGHGSSSLDEEWKVLQHKLQDMRSQINHDKTAAAAGDDNEGEEKKKDEEDPLNALITALHDKPRIWQERIEALPYQAAAAEEGVDEEHRTLRDAWERRSRVASARQTRLTELRGALDALRTTSDDLDADLHDARDAVSDHAARRRRARDEAAARFRRLATVTIPRLQQRISMYVTCTGIKWDYDNQDAWTGYVNVPSKQTYQRFYFPRDEVSPEEIMEHIWGLMEG